jgi:hypothetical protein
MDFVSSSGLASAYNRWMMKMISALVLFAMRSSMAEGDLSDY